MRELNVDQLFKAGACLSEREYFLQLFPAGYVEITEELCAKHAHDFSFQWAIRWLLSPLASAAAMDETHEADAAYQAAMNESARVYYQATHDAPVWAQNEGFRVRRETNIRARIAYKEGVARIFARAYLADGWIDPPSTGTPTPGPFIPKGWDVIEA